MEQWIQVQFFPEGSVESLPGEILAGVARHAFQENEWNFEIAFEQILPLELVKPMSGYVWLETDLLEEQTGERFWRRVIVLGDRIKPVDQLWWEHHHRKTTGRKDRFPDQRYRTTSTSTYGGIMVRS